MDNRQNVPETNELSQNAVVAAGVKTKIMPTVRDRLFFVAVIALGFALFDFALGNCGIGTTAYFLMLFIITAVYLMPWKSTALFPVLCGALGMVLSVGFSVSCQTTVTFFTILAVEFLYLVFAGGISGNLAYGTDTVAVSRDALRIFFSDSVEEVGAVFRTGKGIKDGGQLLRNIFKCTLGIVIAVPLVCVVIPLLTAADGAFDAFITRIVEADLGFDFSHLLYAIVLCPFTCGMLFSLKHKQAQKKKRIDLGFAPVMLDPMITAGFLGVLTLCYLLYVYSQLGYFFSAFGGSIPNSVKTAAAYARRGFFELCAISVINFASIALAMFKTKQQGAYRVCKWMAVFISAFSIMLIATAQSKMLLYIKLYGLTMRRMLPSIFMVLLALAFVLLAIRIIKGRFPYMRIFVSVCAVTLILMNFADMSAVAANYNVEVYLNKDAAWHTSTVEVDYLRSLGEPALPALVRLYKEAEDPSVRDTASAAIERIRLDITFENKEDGVFKRNWRDYSVAGRRADKAYDEYVEARHADSKDVYLGESIK